MARTSNADASRWRRTKPAQLDTKIAVRAATSSTSMPPITAARLGQRSGQRPSLTTIAGSSQRAQSDQGIMTKATERSVGAAVAAVCRTAAADFFRTDPLGDASPTADNVHDARIALRRVRSCLRSFRSLFPGDWADDLRKDLSWYANELSAIRDLDVFAARIAAIEKKTVPEVERTAALELVAARRAAEVERLQQLRNDPIHRLAVIRLEALATGLPLSGRAEAAARRALPRLMRRPYAKARDAARRARAKPSVTRLHELRIRAKELRYAGELATPVLGERAARLAKSAQRVQDHIGAQRDALLAADFLDLAVIGRHAPLLRSGRLSAALRREARLDAGQLRKDLRKLRKAWKAIEQRR